uniref:Amino acid transporter transmembrane domain-containing protein n=1 Tax=Mantoniella antarctica TaxID=81844 RepID=A0A6U3G8T0_9CHLO
MANSVNILLGVGLLSVPYALQQGGWAGLGVLATLGAMTNYTGKALIRCQTSGSLPPLAAELEATTAVSEAPLGGERRPLLSYEDIGEAAFGAGGRAFITFVLYTELIGTCALFFILEGDHLAILLHDAHSSRWFMTASAAVMIPTLWLADLSSLSYVGAVGALASVSLMGVVAYQLVAVGIFSGHIPPGIETTAALHLSTLPVSFGLLAFVFAGHAVFPAIYSSMDTPEDYEGMLDRTYGIVGVTCLIIGCAGYALWGEDVADEVTLNLPGGAASTLALALITINPLSKFALTMDPVARGLESALGVDISAKQGNGPLTARAMRTGLGLGALTVAATVPFFAVVMSLIGSFLTLTVSVIFPAACYLKMFEGEIGDGEKALNWAIMLLGGFGVVAGSYSALGEISATLGSA